MNKKISGCDWSCFYKTEIQRNDWLRREALMTHFTHDLKSKDYKTYTDIREIV